MVVRETDARIAVAQFAPVVGNKKSNLEKTYYYMSRAAEEGADLLLVPEMFLTGYTEDPTDMVDMAEDINGTSIQQLKTAAAKNNVALVGSFLERDTTANSLYNTSVFINAEGELLGTFRKIHLFDDERKIITPGDKITTINYKNICYGLLICFDVEFPELARSLALAGAQVLLVVSANMKPYGHFHRNYVLARAQENHTFVAYCNQVGSNNSWDFVGDSCLVNPSGEIICELAGEEGITAGDINLSEIARSQEVYNYLKERRVFFEQ